MANVCKIILPVCLSPMLVGLMTTHQIRALQGVLYWEKTHQVLLQASLLLVSSLGTNASALEIPTLSVVEPIQ